MVMAKSSQLPRKPMKRDDGVVEEGRIPQREGGMPWSAVKELEDRARYPAPRAWQIPPSHKKRAAVRP